MIPDGFQYLFDDFWKFKTFHQIWPLTTRMYHQITLTNTRNMEISLKYFVFSHLNIFGNPKFPELLPLPDIKHVELLFSFVLLFSSGGSKTIGFSKRFQRIVGCGILMFVGNRKS